MTTAERVEKRIAQRLANALQPGSPNAISAASVREWAVEYLAEYDNELAEIPPLRGQTHWNLWMMDARYEDAMFVALVFRESSVEFFCGTGNAFEIKSFDVVISETPDDFESLHGLAREQFSIPDESLHLKREEAEAWLGRGGWCG